MQDKIVEDKTFGLKNKSKSKKVQQYVKQVESNVKGQNIAAAEKAKTEKKNAKIAKMQVGFFGPSLCFPYVSHNSWTHSLVCIGRRRIAGAF